MVPRRGTTVVRRCARGTRQRLCHRHRSCAAVTLSGDAPCVARALSLRLLHQHLWEPWRECTMTLEVNRLYSMDCIEGLKQVDTGSVDLAFADPPFNIGYEYDVYDDRRRDEEYLEWCRQWISELHRVLKSTGTFWLAIGDEYAAELKLLAQREIGFHCRSWV